MIEQSTFSVAGEGMTMRAAVDDADEQMNEFFNMDTKFLHVTHMCTQSLYANGMFYHTITIFIQNNTEA